MAWNESDFMAQIIPLEGRYKDDNKWFYKSTSPPWKEEASHAWLLYTRANENALETLILGDAKIRTTRDLLMNFGLASGGGIDNLQEIQAAKDIQDWRDGNAKGTTQSTTTVVGPGSILNDKHWTPMLNDAFILGGAHGYQDFHWSEAAFAQYAEIGTAEFLRTRDKAGPAAPQYAAALKRDGAYYQGRWKEYLKSRSNFWAGGFVRVFARELIGLKGFGYKPVYSSIEIMFKSHGDPESATFAGYLEALSAVKFEEGEGSSALINAELGEFLFGDKTALSSLSTGKK